MIRITPRCRGRVAAAALLVACSASTACPSAVAVPMLPSLPIGSAAYSAVVDKPGGDPGYLFYTTGMAATAILPGLGNGSAGVPAPQSANVIADKAGREIWRYTPPDGMGVSNFRTQTYRGKPVLTWWQGVAAGGHGFGTDYIADDHYRIIETLTPGDGLTADAHEFRLTPDGHALVTSYQEVTADLTPIGGPRNGRMFDCIASVIDVASKKVVARWDAMQHIPLTDTEFPGLLPGSSAYDPYHINSIALDPAGDLVISMRNTSAVYGVDPRTGKINWQLGGKRSSLTLGPGVEFAFQHDAQFADPTTLRLFNDNSSGPTTRGPSGVAWIRLDLAGRRATLVRNQTHPAGLVAFAMGNAQALPAGHTLVGWGSAPRISEFSATGELLFDATLPFGTYRAYLDPWTGHRG